MPVLEAKHNETASGTVEQTVHVAWSKRRCRHGADVTIAVRTAGVADDAAVVLTILDPDQTEIDRVEDLSLTGGKLDHAYTMDWKDKSIDAAKASFVVKARIDDAFDSEPSAPLTVDLTPPLLSA